MRSDNVRRLPAAQQEHGTGRTTKLPGSGWESGVWRWAWVSGQLWLGPVLFWEHSEWEESGDSRWEKQVRGSRALQASRCFVSLCLVSIHTVHSSGREVGPESILGTGLILNTLETRGPFFLKEDSADLVRLWVQERF
ncbi:hypothetical protein HJG60_011213 [Phyllostomus discolor]|uniref:Uncharacterized protein n=1 Tax=Phyllostomus discolor TaxID=89673 RepID=A0A834A766_9CHIR|nr:hypothetical protein HJG60_011213 [Phyllostomus discolor]